MKDHTVESHRITLMSAHKFSVEQVQSPVHFGMKDHTVDSHRIALDDCMGEVLADEVFDREIFSVEVKWGFNEERLVLLLEDVTIEHNILSPELVSIPVE